MNKFKNNKQLKRYVRAKKGIFHPSRQLSKGSKLLKKQLKEWGVTHKAEYAKCVFLFNGETQSLIPMDHILLTQKGIFWIQELMIPKHVKRVDNLWWQEPTGSLGANPAYQYLRDARGLRSWFSHQLGFEVPIYLMVVSEQGEFEDLMSHTEVEKQLNEHLRRGNHMLSHHQQEQVKQWLSDQHQLAEQQYLQFFDETMIMSRFYPHATSAPSPRDRKMVEEINHFLYEQFSEASLYFDLITPSRKPQLTAMDYLILTPKGFLALNRLEGYSKWEGRLQDEKWSRQDSQGNETQQLNPLLRGDCQMQELLKGISKIKTNVTYRIVGMTPIDLEMKHNALTLDTHLTHTLDRWNLYYPEQHSLSEFHELQMLCHRWSTL